MMFSAFCGGVVKRFFDIMHRCCWILSFGLFWRDLIRARLCEVYAKGGGGGGGKKKKKKKKEEKRHTERQKLEAAIHHC